MTSPRAVSPKTRWRIETSRQNEWSALSPGRAYKLAPDGPLLLVQVREKVWVDAIHRRKRLETTQAGRVKTKLQPLAIAIYDPQAPHLRRGKEAEPLAMPRQAKVRCGRLGRIAPRPVQKLGGHKRIMHVPHMATPRRLFHPQEGPLR